MSFLKLKYIDYFCRVCNQRFCCVNCRLKHEDKIHHVHPGCDICIFGMVLLSTVSENILQHIKTTHLPVNCIFCKITFDNLDELMTHNVCPIKSQKPQTPKLEFVLEDNFDSPPIGSINTKFFSSTPTQKGDNVGTDFENVTPIETSRLDKVKKANDDLSQTPLDNKKKDNKRRVTFGESTCMGMSPAIISQVDTASTTEVNQNKIETNTEGKEQKEIEQNKANETKPVKAMKRRSSSMNDLEWETAIGFDSDSFCSTKKQKLSHSFTAEILDFKEKRVGIWSTMVNVVKSAVLGFSEIAQSVVENPNRIQTKRLLDCEVSDSPEIKRIKLTEIKCRPPIRRFLRNYPYERFVIKVDKATQTDDCLLELENVLK